MELSVWITFFFAACAISVSPGAGAIAAMNAGLQHGFRRGYMTTVGLILGIWTQILIVGVGLGAVVATSTLAFSIVKWLGVAYLVWLGVQQWRAPVQPIADDPSATTTTAVPSTNAVSTTTMILKGWLINTTNPKGTIFLLAVVPQFLNLKAALWPQYLTIAATLGFTDLVVMGIYTALAAKVLGALRSPAHVRRLNRSFGSLFIAAGAMLALFKRSA